MSEQTGYEIPKTIAERNEGLVDFWNRGYRNGLKTAVDQINGEMRWQIELEMRGDKRARPIIDRLQVLANILTDFQQTEDHQ